MLVYVFLIYGRRSWILVLQLIQFSKIGYEILMENLVYLDIQNFCMAWLSGLQTQDTVSLKPPLAYKGGRKKIYRFLSIFFLHFSFRVEKRRMCINECVSKANMASVESIICYKILPLALFCWWYVSTGLSPCLFICLWMPERTYKVKIKVICINMVF